MGKINSKKTSYDGIEFDSQTEAEYYKYLDDNRVELNISYIELQPKFELLPSFEVECKKCIGEGFVPSLKTGKPIKCRRCEGIGKVTKQGWSYTADFLIEYHDDYSEIVDVKGYANERFPLVKKMFEFKNGAELIVVEKTNKGWIRK